MRRRLAVLLNGHEAGEVWQDSQGLLGFSYHEKWRTALDAFPLSFSLPIATADHGDEPVRSYLEGLLPNSHSILDRLARRFGVSARNPFALLEQVGADCPGAVQLLPADRAAPTPVEAEPSIAWLTDSEVEARLRHLRLDDIAGRRDGDLGQFSLPGSQAKTALFLHDGRWGVPPGATPTTHIIKPSIRRIPGSVENEHACLRLAGALGLPVSESRIVRFGEEIALVSTRYDRLPDAHGKISRIHQEDSCQALGVSSAMRFEAEGGPGIGAIVDLLRARSTRPDVDVTTFIETVALHWIIGSPTGHAKRYSILIGPGTVRLAPLYGLTSALPYPEIGDRKMRLAMRIGGKYRLSRIIGDNWSRLGDDLGLDEDALIGRVLALATAVPDLLSDVIGEAEASGSGHPVLRILQKAISERVDECIKVLAM